VRSLFLNADIATLDDAHPAGRCLLVNDGVIEGVLDDAPTGLPWAVKVIDCEGGFMVPGFHDCHAHLTATGLLSGKHDLSACRDIDSMLKQLEQLAASEQIIFAGNFDETKLAERRHASLRELDAACGDRPALLSRVDGHSCVVNSAALALLGVDTAQAGVDRDEQGAPTGRLFGPANYAVQVGFVNRMPFKQHRRADREAAGLALSAGITTLHNVIEGDASYEILREIYIDNAVLPLHVIPKSCSTNIGKIKRLGGKLFGGDIFVDGSIGSRTAALEDRYRDLDSRGLLYLRRERLAELFFEAAEAGLSPGVHAIGDDAIEQAVGAWEDVLARRGSLDGLRPSIDHFEIARPDHITRAARLGVFLSMQPAFDYLWGGQGGMYEQRLGQERAVSMNLLGTARRAGCVVCAGSDSPVTNISALLGIHSAVNHNVPAERLSVDEALRCYTCDAAKLSFGEDRCGRLMPGMAADLAILEKRLDSVAADSIKDVQVRMTVVDGVVQYPA